MEILADALERAPAERAEFLDRACVGHAALRAEVDRLLGREAAAIDALATEHSAKALLDALTPAQVGRYKILRPIGEGGMGLVYLAAQQSPVKRVVALKLVRPGMDSREVIARFESERQALAMMNHPNVAHVHDAGTTELGRPYFVMEYVAGEPITQYCDRHRLGVRERLELFVQVCEAVQHAHQKGIIHRDLKPTNVLVPEHEGRAVPKVIDFGVAKAVQQGVGGHTLYTQRGQLIGTPGYMSPEQAEGGGIDIDTRSDIYSLGVLLYELLTGTLPIDPKTLRSSGLHQIQRTIRDTDPPSPSRRLSSLEVSLADEAARARRTDTTGLRRLVRGDLDWIVMRAMEKDRTRRYASAAALADDVQRYLRDDPVLAGPPSTAYRLRKFARRHRAALVSASLLVGVLLAAVVVSGWLAVRAKRAEAHAVANARRAEEEADRSRRVAAFLSDMLQGVGPAVAQGRDTTLLREILDRTVQSIGTTLRDAPLVEGDLRVTLGQTYYALGLYTQSQEMWTEALRLRRQTGGERHPDVATALNGLAAAQLARGDLASAEASLRQVLQHRREMYGGHHVALAEPMNNLASVLRARGDLPSAEAAFREAATLLERAGGEEDKLAITLGNLAGVLRMQTKFDAAEPIARRALAMRRKNLGETHPDVAASLNSLAVLMIDRGDLDAAEPLLIETLALRQKIFGESHPAVAESLHNLSRLYEARKDPRRALEYAERATEIRRQVFGESHATYAESLFEIGYLRQVLEDLDGADRALRETVAALERAGRTENPLHALALQRLGRNMIQRDRSADAEQLFRKSLASYEKSVRPDDWRIGYSKILIGGSLVRQLQHADANPPGEALGTAEQLMLDGWGIMERYGKPPHTSTRYAAGELARLYEFKGDANEAAKWRARFEVPTSAPATSAPSPAGPAPATNAAGGAA